MLTALTCVAVASAAFTNAAPAMATATESAGTECANFTYLGLRGTDMSEKRLSGGTLDPFGTINSNSANALSALLPDGTISKKVAIPYIPSLVLMPKNGADTASYRESIATASIMTVSAVVDTLAACPQTKIVIIGYGQGAQVAHEAVAMIPRGLLPSVGGIWMISDPTGNPADPNQFYYAGANATDQPASGPYITPHHQAIGADAADVFVKGMAAPNSGFPAEMKPKIVSTCSYMDSWCNSMGPSASDGSYVKDYSSRLFTAEPARRLAQSIANLCASVTFFAARGSGEPFTGMGKDSGQPVQTESPSNYMQGFGVTLASMAYAVETKFPKGSVPTFGHVAVAYDAISVEDAEKVDSPYPHSVQTGIKSGAGPEQFRQLIQRCPDTQVIMLGYSQGGHVIHEIVMELTPAEREHITASVLVADAIRNPKDDGALTFMGTPVKFEYNDSEIYNGMGMMRVVANFDATCLANNSLVEIGKLSAGLFQLPVILDIAACHLLPSVVRFSDVVSQETYPSDFFKKSLNVCALKDVVCDTQPSLDANSSYGSIVANFGDVGNIHGEGYKKPEFYDFPSSWAYSRLTLTNEMRHARR